MELYSGLDLHSRNTYIGILDTNFKRLFKREFERLSLKHLYRAMDIMAEHKEEVERELFWQGGELFDYGLDLVFFDTTSVYFEGQDNSGFCEQGFSKDHRPEDICSVPNSDV